MLFADVVQSMDIAAALGPEALHDVMGLVFDHCAAVVIRYGGTVDKFTGDGLMAVFGAPIAMEDHALAACRAAEDIQAAMPVVNNELRTRHSVDVALRIGLNSGQVIAGEVGSHTTSYTAVGEHVGLAQRMEAAAAPGGVMLSESTVRLVEHNAVLGDPESVSVKGRALPLPARRLIETTPFAGKLRHQSTMVGRAVELEAIEALLDRAIGGAGGVVSVVGPPGIGKSRLVVEATRAADERGVDVYTAFGDIHTAGVAFHVVTKLLRAAFGVDGVDSVDARASLRASLSYADDEDRHLIEDLLGVRDTTVPAPAITPDARRRRIADLINGITLHRTTPVVFVIEDVHWIDEASEALLDVFLTVTERSPSLVLISYRPEYTGTLSQLPHAHRIVLKPLARSELRSLATELLGADSSTSELTEQISERAAGNPFFAKEIVLDLAERHVLVGTPGHYLCHEPIADIDVPPTVQATIAARIDRLPEYAKRTLNAAAVIGSSFTADLLSAVDAPGTVSELIVAELVDPVDGEFTFRHPLIRAVAYESQLRSERAELHRRLAHWLEHRRPDAVDRDAALIATHLEAAGDLHGAFAWQMRAGGWLNMRDNAAARACWTRALELADRLPAQDDARSAMRIAPRTLLCATAWHAGTRSVLAPFDELRTLAAEADDKVALTMGMAGQVVSLVTRSRYREATELATEVGGLIDGLSDPATKLGLLLAVPAAKYEAGDLDEAIRVCEQMITLAGDDATLGEIVLGSPLAMAYALRGAARAWQAIPGWRGDVTFALSATAHMTDVSTRTLVYLYVSFLGITNDAMGPEDLIDGARSALEAAERSGDDFDLASARFAVGVCELRSPTSDRAAAVELLTAVIDAAAAGRCSLVLGSAAEVELAADSLTRGDARGAQRAILTVFEWMEESGEALLWGPATRVLVDALLYSGGTANLPRVEELVSRLAHVSAQHGLVLNELYVVRLKAVVARARGDESSYCDYRNRYRAIAERLGFTGHIAAAAAMV